MLSTLKSSIIFKFKPKHYQVITFLFNQRVFPLRLFLLKHFPCPHRFSLLLSFLSLLCVSIGGFRFVCVCVSIWFIYIFFSADVAAFIAAVNRIQTRLDNFQIYLFNNLYGNSGNLLVIFPCVHFKARFAFCSFNSTRFACCQLM